MSNRCDVFELLISRKLDNDLSEAEEAALRGHLSTCPDCRALAETLTAVTLSLRGDTAEPPEALASSVMERIDAYHTAPKRRPFRPWAKVLIAASLALVIGAGGFAAWVGTGRMGSSADSAVMEEAVEEIAMEAPAAEAPAAAMAEEAPAMPMPEPMEDAGAGYSTTTAEEDGAWYGNGGAEEAEPEQDTDILARLAALYTLDSPAFVPEGQEAFFESLLTDAGADPGDELTVFSYVEYRGGIYEFSTDGHLLVWRDTAEGFPTVSPAPIEAFLDIFA